MNLPLIEDIYDFETDQLQDLHRKLKAALESNELPEGWQSLEKFQKKGRKLLQPLELQLHQRQQLDNILDFFLKAKVPEWDETHQQAPQPTVSSASTNCDSVYKSSQIVSDENSANFMTPSSRQSDYQESKSEYSSKQSNAVSTAGWKTKSSAKGKKKMAEIMREKLAKTRITSSQGGDAITVGRSAVPTGPRLPLAPRQSASKQTTAKNSNNQVQRKLAEKAKSLVNKPIVRSGSQQKKRSEQITKPTHVRDFSKTESKETFNVATTEKSNSSTIEARSSKSIGPKHSNFKSIASIEPEKKARVEEQRKQESQTSVKKQEKSELVSVRSKKLITEQGKEIKISQSKQESKEQESQNKEVDQVEAQREPENIEQETTEEKKEITKKDEEEQQHEKGELTHSSQKQAQEKVQDMVKPASYTHKERGKISQKSNEEEQLEQVPEDIDPPSPPAKEVKEEIKIEPEELHLAERIQNISNGQFRESKQLEDQSSSKKVELKQKKADERPKRIPQILKLIERTQALSAENKTQLQELSEIQKTHIEVKSTKPERVRSSLKKQGKKEDKKENGENENQDQKEKQHRYEEKIAKYLKEEELLKQSTQEQSKQKKKEEPKESQQTSKKKAVKAKSKIASIQKALEDPNIVDYSKCYKCFNEIFSCFQSAPKIFDAPVLYRDTRNMYQNFIALMDSSCLFFNKHQFEMDPLSQAQQKSMMYTNHLLMAQKDFSDRELEIKNSDNELMIMAMQQAQIYEKYKQLKDSPDNKVGILPGIENQSLIVPNRQPTLYFRVIKNKAEVYQIITMAFHRKKRWNELPHGVDLRHSWNLLWSWSKSKIDHNKLLVWQRINHFQQSKNVSRKDFLKKNIERVQKLSSKCASVFNIMPATFVLPKEYVNFVDEYTRYSQFQGKYNFWIVKPCAMSRGRGISLINDISVSYVDPVIVQKYVRNPLLLNGFKFDLRIYVVVTSVNPLEIFIYKEGFARFSTRPYSISPEDIKDKFIHLTNSSVNKNNNYSELDQTDQLYGGTKIDLKTLKDRLQSKKISWEKIWTQVCQIVVKSFVACQTDIPYNPSCFELFGYDIIIDDNLKCWLIEINSSPSLGRMNLLDDMVKQRLIDDTIDLIECVDFDRKRLVEVLERRIAEEGRATGPTFGGLKQMNRDLTYILNGTVPRKYGEMPRFLGNFERIAPTPFSEKMVRLVGGQKMFGSQSKVLIQDKMERSESKMSLGG